MRNAEEIKQRIDAWEEARTHLYPPVYFGRVTFDRIAAEVRGTLDQHTGTVENEASIRRRVDELHSQFTADKPGEFIRDEAVAELRWVLGEDRSGALRTVVWHILIGQLHDAESTVAKEGTDLTLEGVGWTYDPESPGSRVRVWLKLRHGQCKDQRDVPGPIDRVWILYPKPTESGFALTAQDRTLSGLLTFSAEEYEFRIWDTAGNSA
ncbi:MAG TPA: hypothetical protein VEY12_04285 [Thermoplasmata archaeon]|nr:hypothetical protein [Thermoplasmata archaeon]